jgi:hypothetical protein
MRRNGVSCDQDFCEIGYGFFPSLSMAPARRSLLDRTFTSSFRRLAELQRRKLVLGRRQTDRGGDSGCRHTPVVTVVVPMFKWCWPSA